MKKFKLLFAILLLPLFLFGQVDYVKQAQDAQKEAEKFRDEAVRQKGLAETYAKAGNCTAAKTAEDAAWEAYNQAIYAAGAAGKAAYDTPAAVRDAVIPARTAALESEDAAQAAAQAATEAADGCVPKPQEPDYVKQAQDAQKKAEAARDEVLRQKDLAKQHKFSGNCAAAKQAADAAYAATKQAAAAREAAFSAMKADPQQTAVQRAFFSAQDASQAADEANDKAQDFARNCVPKPQKPDYLKQAQDAQKEAETQRDNAVRLAGERDCDKARAAANAAKAAAEDAASVTFDARDGDAAVRAATTAAARAAKADEDAADDAADDCIPKTPPPPPPAPSRLTATPTAGGSIGAAQPSATIGYCYHRDKGIVPIYENSNITAGTYVGMIVSCLSGEGEPLSSVEPPRSPYASFASYRTSASGNAAPAPALPPVQGGQLDLMSLNLGVNYLRLKGEDRHPERGASFDKKMVEVLATGDFYFINLLRAKRATSSPKVAPFLRLGAGFGIGNPNTVNGEKDTKKANFALPMGLGFRVNVSDKMALNLDYTTRATFSDALDGVSSSTGGKDWYGSGGLGLSFMLGKKANDSDGDGVKNNDDPCPTVAGTLGGCPDTDGDGIGDKEDTCPNEAGDQRFNGCPDTDGDGVANNIDDCPNDAGLRRFAGCPDTDGDNIIDKEDRCPTVAGLAATNGCPDADRDGVIDDKDDCPNDPGPAEQNGCPDTDDDGIGDNKDECPEVFGLGKFKGCPDTDEDGVSDPMDKCPNLKGPVGNQGCPEILASDKAVLDKAMRNVKFRSSSAELITSSKSYLDQIAEVMSRYKGFKLSIDGYTDNEGPAAANQSLSEARAKACYDYLSSIGVRLSLMTYKGHGPTNPIGDNSTQEGRLKNRRVEFTLIPQ